MQLWPEKREKRSRLMKMKNMFGSCVWREVQEKSSEECPDSSGTPKSRLPRSCRYPMGVGVSHVWSLKAGLSTFLHGHLLLEMSWISFMECGKIVTKMSHHKSMILDHPSQHSVEYTRSCAGRQAKTVISSPPALWQVPSKQSWQAMQKRGIRLLAMFS
jgi:hypothetical protein